MSYLPKLHSSRSGHKQAGKSNLPFILVAVIAIGIGFLTQTSKELPAETPEFKTTILLPTPKALVEAEFQDHLQNTFGSDEFKGKWSILFFGFTNCPDICPTTMQTLKLVKQKLVDAEVWHNFRIIMISVDPERDTTERLANYVPYFDSEFIGLSADVDSTASFAKNLGILFFKSDKTENGGYDVDHGASIILVNPEGQYAGVITAPHIEAEISADLIALAGFAGVTKSDGPELASEAEKAPAQVDESPNVVQEPGLSFKNAWIRPAPPTANNMAAYFDLVNNTDEDIVIEGSESSAFNMSMIHSTVIEDGIASMKHLDSVRIAAGESLSFKPLGMHMMLMGPKAPLVEGQTAELVLLDNTGKKYTHLATVKQQANK